MSDVLLISFVAAPFALLLDFILGEPKKFHPLVGFGNVALWLEARMNNKKSPLIMGTLAWLFAVLPFVLLLWLAQQFMPHFILFLINIFFGWLAIGWNSLAEHGLNVANAFDNNDIEQARLHTSYLVSRDTTELNETQLSRATIESVLENGSDAVIAAVFWLCLLGAPGVVLYRLSNTLDAMWGYRNARFERFGKFSARVDDMLNYFPARVCALLYTFCGNSKQALCAWHNQSNSWYSPNAGVVMASGAGALEIKLGGSAVYHGKSKHRPVLGYGRKAQTHDVKRSIALLNRSVYLLGMLLILVLTIYQIFSNAQLF